MKLTTFAFAVATSTLAFAVAPCHAASNAQIAHDEMQVEQAATKECEGDTGDGVGKTVYSGDLAGIGSVTVVSAQSNGCAGGQATRTWLWLFLTDGSASQANQPPNSVESVKFSGDQILVTSLEVGPEDSPNFPSHLTQFVFKVVGRKLTLASSKFLAIKKD